MTLSPSFAVTLGCHRETISWNDVQSMCLRGDMEKHWLPTLHKIIKEKFGLSDGCTMNLYSKNLAGKIEKVTPLPCVEYPFTKYWNKMVPTDVKLGPNSYGELTVANITREQIKFSFSLRNIRREVMWDPNRVLAPYSEGIVTIHPCVQINYFDRLWEDIQVAVAEKFVLRSTNSPAFVFCVTDHEDDDVLIYSSNCWRIFISLLRASKYREVEVNIKDFSTADILSIIPHRVSFPLQSRSDHSPPMPTKLEFECGNQRVIIWANTSPTTTWDQEWIKVQTFLAQSLGLKKAIPVRLQARMRNGECFTIRTGQCWKALMSHVLEDIQCHNSSSIVLKVED